MPDVIQIRLNLPTAQGPRPVVVDVEDVPTTLAELAPLAHMVTDTFVESAAADVEAGGDAVSCRRGCAACCRHYVAISIPEALHLLEQLDGLSPDDQERFRRRSADIALTLKKQKLLKRALDPGRKPRTMARLPREYFRLQLACPFLDDEVCSIHPHRPTGCRSYGVVSDPALCQDPYRNDIVPLATPLAASGPLARATAKLLGKEPTLLPLSLFARWSERLRPLAERTWPGPALVRAFARELFPEA